jgi:hypothetical protein
MKPSANRRVSMLARVSPSREMELLDAAWRVCSPRVRVEFISRQIGAFGPRSPSEATRQSLQTLASNQIDRFAIERTVTRTGNRVQSTALYRSYATWCGSIGERPATHKAFSLAMARRGLRRQQSNTVWWLDVALKEQAK